MELERLRILIEASTGDSATQVGRLNKILEQHAGGLKLAEKAAQAAERAEKLHKAGVTQAGRAIVEAMNERKAAQAAMARELNRTDASLKKATAAEVAATLRQKALKDAIEKTNAAAARSTAVFAQVDRALAQSAQAAAGSTKGQKSLGDMFFGAMQKAFFFMSAVDRVHAALGKLYSASEEAARNNTAKMYFDDAGKSLERLQAVAKGQIADSDLIKKSNLADSMGLSSEVFERLIQVAQAASAKTGQAFDHMFDSIVLGTARSSRLLLDNLGIIVNVKQAHLEYAQELIRKGEVHGKTAREVAAALTAEGKQAAFLTAMYKATNEQVEQLNKLGQGGAAVFDRFAASMDNLKQAMMTSLLPAISWALDKLADLAERIARMKDPKAVTDRLIASGYTGGAFAGDPFAAQDPNNPVAKALARGGGMDNEEREELIDQADTALTSLVRQIEQLTAGQLNVQSMFGPRGEVTASAIEFAMAMGADAQELSKLMGRAQRLNIALKRFTNVVEKSAGDHVDFGDVGAGKGKKEKAYGLTDEAFDEGISEALKKMDADFLASIGQWNKFTENLLESLRNAAAWRIAPKPWDRRESGMLLSGGGTYQEDLANKRAEQDYYDKQGAEAIGYGATLVSGDTGAVVEMLATAIGAAAGSPGIGAAIGKLLSPFLNSMGGLTDVVMGLFNGFSLLIEHAVGPLLSTLAPLGEALQYLMAAVGKLIAAALEPLIPLLKYFFAGLAVVIDFITALIVVLGPVIGLFAELAYAFLSAGIIPLFNAFMGGGDTMVHLTETMNRFGESMIMSAIGFNNAIVAMVNNIGKFLKNDYWSTWGDKLDWDDFQVDSDEDDGKDDNTDAVNENTRALRDLAREFHNLPSGYKGNAAIYNAANREAPYVLQNPTLRNRAVEQMSENALSSRRFNPFR